jgi:oligopeptide transport system ATP-binding protein
MTGLIKNDKAAGGLATAEHESVVEVRDLTVSYEIRTRTHRRTRLTARASTSTVRTIPGVDKVSFDIRAGEILGVVGESGCGKSTLARAIAGAIRPTAGTIRFPGTPDSAKHRPPIGMVLQDPQASLNPRQTVGSALNEPLIVHSLFPDPQRRRDRVKSLIEEVGLDESALKRYPHEFSGGQRQRIAIARAIAIKPRLLICDESVSALDVSVQAKVMNLLLDLRQREQTSIMFISHDLAAVGYVADRIVTMYLGRIVELADKRSILASPEHPYTQLLIGSQPTGIGFDWQSVPTLGEPPNPANRPAGCNFRARCPLAQERCGDEPELTPRVHEDHLVACHFAGSADAAAAASASRTTGENADVTTPTEPQS